MGEIDHKCLNCSSTSDDRPLIVCEFKGKESWVCVRCLPVLIHGSD